MVRENIGGEGICIQKVREMSGNLCGKGNLEWREKFTEFEKLMATAVFEKYTTSAKGKRINFRSVKKVREIGKVRDTTGNFDWGISGD